MFNFFVAEVPFSDKASPYLPSAQVGTSFRAKSSSLELGVQEGMNATLSLSGFDTQAAGLSAEGVSKPTQPDGCLAVSLELGGV